MHHSFLAEWLPSMRKEYRIYLETNGIGYSAMEKLRQKVDVVSMDLKLPSATGLQAFWSEHGKFLAAARGTLLFAKAVVTADTTDDDVLTAARLLADCGDQAPLIIQPASGRFAPAPESLFRFQNMALAVIADVRVIPQVHRMLNVP
ncbi:MAG: hypothetical protein A2078_08760 [Nitrospirae bacterium GWC2_57_9]|nr:MAG: hypothetical protein A2078_08760 [Nitrospirae bacterium GWC2_57_9]